MFLSRSKYVEEILERAHMQHCSLCRKLADTESKLGPDGSHANNPTLDRRVVGAI